MRICLVYDCFFPNTIGGAERWYRELAEKLVDEGHEVTYLTLRQWERGHKPVLPGVRLIAVGPRMKLYVDGTLVGTNAAATRAKGIGGSWRVGGDATASGDGWFDGMIDNVAVYNSHALTATQV